MKIAHFGTFDVENYGDLLFPLILEQRLSDLAESFIHVSPIGGPPVWRDCVETVSFDQLLRNHADIDAMVVGGGNIIHSSPQTVKNYDSGFSPYAYPSLWLGAAYASAKGNLPLCWNSPGVPREFSTITAELVQWAASVTDYLSVRDEASRELLERAGVDRPVSVVPDTALEVSRLWSKEEISVAYADVFARRQRSKPDRTIVFHLNSRYVDEDTSVLAARLDRICSRLEATAILIAIGPCHGDDELQRQVAWEMTSQPVVIDRPGSLREIAACIAHSEAYVGSSLHGMITACSFGSRGLLVASKRLSKFQGFLEQFDLSSWQSPSWERAEQRVDDLLATSESTWKQVMESAAPQLDQHWEQLRASLTGEQKTPETPNKRFAIERLQNIGKEYLGEGAIFQGILVDHLIGSRSEAQEKENLARQLEQANQEIERTRREIDKVRERARREIYEAERDKETLKKRLSKTSKDTQTLIHWMEEINLATTALLNSRQWKAGRALGEIYRLATRRPRTPMAQDHLRDTLTEFQTWKIQKGLAEKIERPALTQRSENNASLPKITIPAANPKNLLWSIAASAREKLTREARRLKPRMSKDQLASEIRRRLGPPPELESWPRVSIVISNHNGLPHLKKLFHGLETNTDYPDFEVIVVDNGSVDGSSDFVRSLRPAFPVELLENRTYVPPAASNNEGAKRASGELLLFLSSRAEPFESSWLRELVNCIRHSCIGAVGATLVHPDRTGHPVPSGYTIQHRGTRFRKVQGLMSPYDLEGDDVLENLGEDTLCPAVSAACLLIEHATFDSIGGFTEKYHSVNEDVDLSLKVLESGRGVLCSGRSLVFHNVQNRPNGAKRQIALDDQQTLIERWGPLISRTYYSDLLSYKRTWTEAAPHIAITVSSLDMNDGFGDWYTAHEIGDALERQGWRVTYVQRKNDEWYTLPDDVDYVLALLHWYDPTRVSGVTTIAWIRNWTERWVEHPYFEHFDVVLVSSGISKEIVESRTCKSASVFPIATNPNRFRRTQPNPIYEADYVFTGNHWGGEKGEQRLVDVLDVYPEETVKIFGKGWEFVPRASRYARGHLPYDELPKVYSSAKLVIDDAGHTTRPYGSVNSRVFDALATGTLVISSCKDGVRELFDDEFPSYENRQELRSHLDRLLCDESYRNELARRYQKIVLREHTYDLRAQQLTELLCKRNEALSFCIKIGPRDWRRAPSWGDLHYARALQRQLERRGYPCLVQVLEEWDNFEGLEYDVVIHLKGLTPYTTKPGQFNVLWNISHPELVTPRECDKYDLVFVASERFAAELRGKTKTPVIVLQQATDPDVFFPDPDPEFEYDLVFVGNSRKVERRILRDLLPTNHNLAVWGSNWEGLIDDKYVVDTYLPNQQVRKAYSTASIVLNDHWDDMREHGFISNRIYDALACGALVISDHLPEIEQVFGDAVVTYETPEELKRLVDYYLSSPRERAEKGRRGRELVLEQHTFDRRVEKLLQHIKQRIEETGFQTRVASPDTEFAVRSTNSATTT